MACLASHVGKDWACDQKKAKPDACARHGREQSARQGTCGHCTLGDCDGESKPATKKHAASAQGNFGRQSSNASQRMTP